MLQNKNKKATYFKQKNIQLKVKRIKKKGCLIFSRSISTIVSKHFTVPIVKVVNPTTQTTYALRKVRINYYLQQ